MHKIGRVLSSPLARTLAVCLVLAVVVFVASAGASFAQVPTPAPVTVPDMSGTVTGGIVGAGTQLGNISAAGIALAFALWAAWKGLNMIRGNV